MHRFMTLVALVALCMITTISCARGPVGDRVTARPVPSRSEISDWLEIPVGEESRHPAFFIQMADPQLGMSGSPLWLALSGATWNDDAFQVDARLFERAIAHANELNPAFVVICGDLVNRVGHSGQIAEFQHIASTLNPSIPLYLVAGYHDVGNEPTQESLRAYRATFGPDGYSFR
jgi:hypothetical protein